MNRFINVLRPFRIAALFIGLSFVGCGVFSPRSDPSRFFTLSSLPREAEVAVDLGSPETLFLGIGPITFPGYLDRQEMVVRSGQNRFELSENDRWAEPLEENFSRVLSQNLLALLPASQIVPYPWPRNAPPNYQVRIEVLRFEANHAREAELSARWIIVDTRNSKPVILKESHLTRPARDKSTDARVAALSEALGALSREIAEGVRALKRP